LGERVAKAMGVLVLLGSLGGCASPAAHTDARAPSDVADGSADGSAPCASLRASALCAGQRGLTLAYQVMSGLSRVEPGSAVLHDNGAAFFLLRGDCHYWAQESTRTDAREGVTTAAEVERLFGLHRLCGMGGVVRGASRDGATVRLAARGIAIDCTLGCSGGDVPASLRQASLDAFDATRALWGRGQPLTSGYRLVAVSGQEWPPTVRPFEWPLRRPLAAFSFTPEQAIGLGPGRGHAVSDPAEVAALTELRRQHLELSEYQRGPNIRVASTGENHAVWMRPMLPLEDEGGVIPVAALLGAPSD